jgi:diguanylate cyclase (GGDEF)-like protein
VIVIVALACVLVLGTAVMLDAKSTGDMRALLSQSIKSQLISTSHAARELINVDAFIGYESIADTDADPEYAATLEALRHLGDTVGAKYIYALKYIDGKAYFIFDTDREEDTRFVEYELFDVHLEAFAGDDAADVMNVEDIYGSFNTGAVPLLKDGRVVGIVSVDIEDTLLAESYTAATNNTIMLVLSLLAIMGVLALVAIFMRRLWIMNDEAHHRSLHDTITGLPNRRYLMEQLGSAARNEEEFALVFVDLDNFKLVNDNFGHDAGDELLVSFAAYLQTALYGTESFRPAPGSPTFAARIGGDEFIQIVYGVETEDDAAVVAEKLLSGFVCIEDRCIAACGVGMSIGIALCPRHSTNPHKLLKYADVAMYHAKRNGKHGYCIYAETLGDKVD